MCSTDGALRLRLVIRRGRGLTLLATGIAVAVGALMPWITITWESLSQTPYGPFQSQVLGWLPGIVAWLIAIVLIYVGLCDLGISPRLHSRPWHTPLCVAAFTLVGLAIATDSLWENRDAGGSGTNIFSVNQADGALLVMWAVGFAITVCCASALRVTRAQSQQKAPEELVRP